MKKMMIVMMLALFSIAGMSQDKLMVFESSEQVLIKDGQEEQLSEDVVITFQEGVMWIKKTDVSIPMLFTGETDQQTDGEIQVSFFEIIDNAGNRAVLGMALFPDGSNMLRITTDEYEVYYKGGFLEDVPPKSGSSFKTVS